MPHKTWIFEKSELPWWVPARPSPAPSQNQATATPAEMPAPVWPLLGRIVVSRVALAAAFPVLVWIGSQLAAAPMLGELVVGSCLLGFAFGLLLYVRRLFTRSRAVELGPLKPATIPPPPSVWLLAAPPLLFPLALLGTVTLNWLFSNRFIGLTLLTFLCLLLFHWFGARPIRFNHELLLADPLLSLNERKQRLRDSGNPQLARLAIILLIVWLVPAYASNTWTIIAVALACVIQWRRSFKPLLRYQTANLVFAGLWMRAGTSALRYLDYSPVDKHHWRPSESATFRRAQMAAMFLTFDLTLLIGLTYYLPWEPFATLFVSDFQSNAIFIPQAAMTDYRWLTAPFVLAAQAKPLAAYLCCFVLAFALFFVIPFLILLLTYMEQLASLENVAQQIKQSDARRRGMS